MEKIKQVGVIGAGVMGVGIAMVAASSGHLVTLCDVNKIALENSKTNLKTSLKILLEKQKITGTKAAEIFECIQFASDLTEFKNCELIIEAIVENLELKQQLFSEVERLVSASCVLASNTSSLSIAAIASACKNPERIIGLHFFNPAPVMPLVEISASIYSDPEIVESTKELIKTWGKTVVFTNDSPGFIVNRIARPFYSEAICIYEEGLADFQTIDWAMKTFGGFKMGPFELMDFVGVDLNYKVTKSIWEQFFYEPRFKPSITQTKLYEAKWFGRKTGRGFYNYAENSAFPEPNKDETLGKYIFNRILAMLINEAIETLFMNTANRDDIDLAMTKGVNYPKGLLKWADDLGLPQVLDTLNSLYREYDDERYRSSELLKQMVRDGKTFY